MYMFINVNLCWNWIEKFWTTRRNVIYQNLEEIGPIDSKSQSIEKYDCGKFEKRRKSGYDNSCSIKTGSKSSGSYTFTYFKKYLENLNSSTNSSNQKILSKIF